MVAAYAHADVQVKFIPHYKYVRGAHKNALLGFFVAYIKTVPKSNNMAAVKH